MPNFITFHFDTGFSIYGFRHNDGWGIDISGVLPDIERAFIKVYGNKRFKRIYDIITFVRNFTEAKLIKVEIS